MNPLDSIWSRLPQPDSGLNAVLHPESGDVWLALDPEGRRHLLVRATSAEAGERLLETRGLRVALDWLSPDGEAEDVWVDLACLESALNSTFSLVANDLVEEITANRQDPVGAVRKTLRTWQWFWGVDPTSLTGEAALGLFGELWFMDRWVPSLETALQAWAGPSGDRHDFVWPTLSVEVKATRVPADGPTTHRIANLDQLADPESGNLYLFSLQAVPDRNASNGLVVLVERLRDRLADRPDVLERLERLLARAKWTPAAAEQHSLTYRVVSEELYRVGDGFPRLTRESFGGEVPFGIEHVRYSLDLAACGPWRIATAPWEAAELMSSVAP